MKKLDDAKRRFGVPTGFNPVRANKGMSAKELCLHFGVPEVLADKAKFKRSDADTIALQKMEIEALNKLLNERDELLDSLVNTPSELGGWMCCLVLIICVFVAHGLGYM